MAKVTKVVTGEGGEMDELGGPQMHAKVTGCCHAVLHRERAGIAWLQRLLSLLAPEAATEDPSDRAVPDSRT